jgi:mono/diheme cytochrome c family protein
MGGRTTWYWSRLALPTVLALGAMAGRLGAQEVRNETVAGTAAAVAAARQDPAAVERGGKLFVANCGVCHGNTAKGRGGAPDLIRSLVVLDDEKGNLLGPVVREGRPDKGMPPSTLTAAQISDIVAWLHVQAYAAGNRRTYAFQDVLTGDAKKGEAYFHGAGKCSTCHSVTGDLAEIGKRHDPFALQSRWLHPRAAGRGPGGPRAASGSAVRVTVSPPTGPPVTGVLDYIDDFNASLWDTTGEYRSFRREKGAPKVELHDPLQGHWDLLERYTDADIHNVTAYLATLK